MAGDIRIKLGIDGVPQVQAGANAAAAALDKTARAADGTAGSFGGLNSAAGSLKGLGSLIGGVFAVDQLASAAAAFVRTADGVTVLRNQLTLASGDAKTAARAYDELFGIAQRSRTSFTELGSTYASIARATDGLGISQARLLTVTEAIGNAMAISGGNAAGMQAALTQLGQGLASGTLRGDELNSVLEQTPRLARAIADGMGITVGKLRAYGQEGKITAEAVIQALESQAAVLSGEVQTSVVTVGQAWTQLGNSATKAVGELDRATGTTSSIAGAMQSLSGTADAVADRFTRAREAGHGFFGALAAAQAMAIAEALGHVDANAGNISRRLADAEKEAARLQKLFAQNGGIYLQAKAAEAAELRDRLREAKQAQDDLKKPDPRDQAQFKSRSQSYADWEAVEAAAAKLLADVRNNALGIDKAYTEQIQKLHEYLQAGALTQAEYTEAVQKLTAATFKGNDAAKKAGEEAKRQIQAGKTLVQQMELQAAGLEGGFIEDWDRLGAAYKAGAISIEQLELAQRRLLERQPFAQAAAKAAADAAEAIASARRKESDAVDAHVAAENARAQTLAATAEEALRQAQIELLTQGKLRSEIAEVTLVRLLDQQAGLRAGSLLYEAKQREIDAQRELIDVLRKGEVRDAGITAAQASADAWQAAANEISQALTDALMTGGKSGAEYVKGYLRTIVGRELAGLFQLGIRVVGNASGLTGGAAGGGGAGTLASGVNAAQGLGYVAGGIYGLTGASTGASAASLTYANAVGALGGDSLGALIAANGSWSGVSAGAAAGSAAAGGAGAGAAAGGASAGGMSSLAALGWAAVVAAVLYAIFGDHSKWSMGTASEGAFDAAGAFGYRRFNDYDFGTNTEHERDAPFEANLRGALAGGISGNAALFGGQAAGFGIGVYTDRDRENEIAALLRLTDASGNTLAGVQTGSGAFGAGGPAGAASKINTADLQKWIAENLPIVVVQGLQQSDLADRFDTYFDSVAASTLTSAKAQEMLATAAAVQQLTQAFTPLGGVFTQFGTVSVEAMAKLAQAAGSFDQLAAGVQGYYGAFYSEAERTEITANSIASALGAVNLVMPETREGFRALVDAQDLSTEAGRSAFTTLMSVAGAFDSVASAAEAAAEKERQRVENVATKRMDLEIELLRAQGDDLAAVALERERELAALRELDPALVGLQEAIYAAADAAEAAAKAEEKRKSVVSGADSVAADFLEGEGLQTYFVDRIRDILGAGGFGDIPAADVLAATREDLVALWQAVGLDGKQTILEFLPLWERLQESIHGTSDAIRDYRAGALTDSIFKAYLGTLPPEQRIAQMRSSEATLLASIATAEDPVAVAQELQQLTVDRLNEEAELREKANRETLEALDAQIDAAKRLQDLRGGIGQFLGELQFGDLSPLNARQQVGSARSLYERTLRDAQAGDVTAQGNLLSNAQAYLQEARGAFGSGAGYAAAYEQVSRELDAFGERILAQKPEIALMEAQRDSLATVATNSADMLAALLRIDDALASRLGEVVDGDTLAGAVRVEGAANDRTFVQGPEGSSGGLSGGRDITDLVAAPVAPAWEDLREESRQQTRLLAQNGQRLDAIESRLGAVAEILRAGHPETVAAVRENTDVLEEIRGQQRRGNAPDTSSRRAA